MDRLSTSSPKSSLSWANLNHDDDLETRPRRVVNPWLPPIRGSEDDEDDDLLRLRAIPLPPGSDLEIVPLPWLWGNPERCVVQVIHKWNELRVVCPEKTTPEALEGKPVPCPLCAAGWDRSAFTCFFAGFPGTRRKAGVVKLTYRQVKVWVDRLIRDGWAGRYRAQVDNDWGLRLTRLGQEQVTEEQLQEVRIIFPLFQFKISKLAFLESVAEAWTGSEQAGRPQAKNHY